jgi:hypothetical protein
MFKYIEVARDKLTKKIDSTNMGKIRKNLLNSILRNHNDIA